MEIRIRRPPPAHGLLVDNRGVPIWWPAFCAAFDITAGAYLAVRVSPAFRSRGVAAD